MTFHRRRCLQSASSTRTALGLAVLALVLALSACTTAVGESDPVSPASSFVLDAIEGQRSPLSCEQLLDGSQAFVLDEGGLVVAVDATGKPLCIDTVEAATAELRAGGLFEQAEMLRREAARLIGDDALPPSLAEPPDAAIDPNPQPSLPALPADEAPAAPPEPHRPPDFVRDPNPQPSCPTEAVSLQARLTLFLSDSVHPR